jgi:hypothetical protein
VRLDGDLVVTVAVLDREVVRASDRGDVFGDGVAAAGQRRRVGIEAREVLRGALHLDARGVEDRQPGPGAGHLGGEDVARPQVDPVDVHVGCGGGGGQVPEDAGDRDGAGAETAEPLGGGWCVVAPAHPGRLGLAHHRRSSVHSGLPAGGLVAHPLLPGREVRGHGVG